MSGEVDRKDQRIEIPLLVLERALLDMFLAGINYDITNRLPYSSEIAAKIGELISYDSVVLKDARK
jgi:hypothetical protein